MGVKPQGISVCLVLTRLVNHLLCGAPLGRTPWFNCSLFARENLRQINTCGGREHVGLRQVLSRGEEFCVRYVRTLGEISFRPQEVCRKQPSEYPTTKNAMWMNYPCLFSSVAVELLLLLFESSNIDCWRRRKTCDLFIEVTTNVVRVPMN